MIRRTLEKSVLLGPLPIRKAAAARTERLEESWILLQPREVRRTYCAQVLDGAGDPDLLAEIWMLRQPKKVRESYIEEVLQPVVAATNGR